MAADRRDYHRQYAAKNRERLREQKRARLGIDPDVREGFVYFFLCTHAGKVKIGFSNDVDGRKRMLDLGRYVDLVELARIPGTQRLNKQIQDELEREGCASDRQGWFEPGTVLTACIARHTTEKG